jgi:hypothetical protein
LTQSPPKPRRAVKPAPAALPSGPIEVARGLELTKGQHRVRFAVIGTNSDPLAYGSGVLPRTPTMRRHAAWQPARARAMRRAAIPDLFVQSPVPSEEPRAMRDREICTRRSRWWTYGHCAR